MTDRNILQRLSFSRYLFQLAIEHAEKPDPLCSVSVLLLHDAVDTAMQLAFEALELERPKNEKYFMINYADAVNTALGKKNNQGLPMSTVTKINGLRNPLKHSTFFIAPSTITQLIGEASVLLNELSRSVFEIEFDRMSLIDLVSNEVVKPILEKAILDHLNGDEQSAYVQLHSALECLKKMQNEKHFHYNYNFRWDADIPEIADVLTNLTDAVSELYEANMVQRAGVSLTEYYKFTEVMPYVALTGNGSLWSFHYTKKPLTDDDFNMCLRFIIEYSMKV